MEHLHATPENKVILNLPYHSGKYDAQLLCRHASKYFIRKLPTRDCAIISLHPHNDRGDRALPLRSWACWQEQSVMEATLFGNGERTGNVDMVTLAMNMYTQGVDPELDFSNMQQDQGDVRTRAPK